MTSLACAVLTISDTRSERDDTSGDLLAELLVEAGHTLATRAIERDNIYQIRATVSAWIADAAIQVVLTTGGTGFTGRDSTPRGADATIRQDYPWLRRAVSPALV